jgi:hypothetical protein
MDALLPFLPSWPHLNQAWLAGRAIGVTVTPRCLFDGLMLARSAARQAMHVDLNLFSRRDGPNPSSVPAYVRPIRELGSEPRLQSPARFTDQDVPAKHKGPVRSILLPAPAPLQKMRARMLQDLRWASQKPRRK